MKYVPQDASELKVNMVTFCNYNQYRDQYRDDWFYM